MRDILNRPHLHELAVSSGFCKRNSKLKPDVFFDLLFYTVSLTSQGSLSYMVSLLKSDFGVSMKKQSLDERFNEKSVFFVKSVLKEVLSDYLTDLYGDDFLPAYGRVLIKDSTKFKTPSTLKENFKSCGNTLSGSSISIQFEYDLKSGSVTALDITSGNRNDRRDASESSDNFEDGDLIIRDLGYFSTSVLQKWSSGEDKTAYFISRLDCSTTVYDANGERVCFKKIYKSMQECNMVEKEMHVFVGEKKRLPVRLLLRLVSEEVYKKRIADKSKKSKGQGRQQLSDETKIRCRFTLFITNAQETSLSLNQVFLLYRLRWQVELRFKSWKSVFEIDGLHQMKESRYLTLLYVKLIQLMLNMQIIHSVQGALYEKGSEKIKIISIDKALKTLKRVFDDIYVMFRGTIRQSKEMAQRIHLLLSEDHWLESKKNKLCFPEILQLFICTFEE